MSARLKELRRLLGDSYPVKTKVLFFVSRAWISLESTARRIERFHIDDHLL